MYIVTYLYTKTKQLQSLPPFQLTLFDHTHITYIDMYSYKYYIYTKRRPFQYFVFGHHCEIPYIYLRIYTFTPTPRVTLASTSRSFSNRSAANCPYVYVYNSLCVYIDTYVYASTQQPQPLPAALLANILRPCIHPARIYIYIRICNIHICICIYIYRPFS